jgi:hypothetical protein
MVDNSRAATISTSATSVLVRARAAGRATTQALHTTRSTARPPRRQSALVRATAGPSALRCHGRSLVRLALDPEQEPLAAVAVGKGRGAKAPSESHSTRPPLRVCSCYDASRYTAVSRTNTAAPSTAAFPILAAEHRVPAPGPAMRPFA